MLLMVQLALLLLEPLEVLLLPEPPGVQLHQVHLEPLEHRCLLELQLVLENQHALHHQ